MASSASPTVSALLRLVCVLFVDLSYALGCICGGSCEVCRDWSEEMWILSDAQRDKRLAKLAERSAKKAKVSVRS